MEIVLSETQNNTMSYLENITTNLENSRNSLRRIARHDDTEFSNQSILNVMERFVKTVNKMDETILVPCRLMDQKVGDENDPMSYERSTKSDPAHRHAVRHLLNSTDLFEIYSMINNVKDELLWGKIDSDDEEEKLSKTNATTTTTQVKGHVRRPSSVSVASTNSTTSTLSDTDSESGVDAVDSGIDESTSSTSSSGGPPPCGAISRDFRKHLGGLTQTLRQMTEAAQYLTWRYQYDIAGGPV